MPNLGQTDRFIIGIMTTADSPAAIEGDYLFFAACSSRCEKIIRKEAARGLKRAKRPVRLP